MKNSYNTKEYLKEQEAVLKSLDTEALRKLIIKYKPEEREAAEKASDEDLLRTIHEFRVNCQHLDPALREESYQWLTAYHEAASLDKSDMH